VWITLASVMSDADLGAQPPRINILQLTLDRYARLLADPIFTAGLRNSALTAGVTTLVTLVLGSLAGYALARMRPPGGGVFLGAIVATQMVPALVLIIPVYIMMRTIGLLDTIPALATVYTAFLLPYVIWILKNSFQEIPRSLESAARIDGASRLQVLRLIVLPVAAPALAATAIFTFISAWNEFLFALVLTTREAKTAIVRLSEVNQFFAGARDYSVQAAAAVLTVLPLIVMVVVFHRFVVRGLLEGTVKG
jgi:multiple sugar transport system permease protein